MGGFFLHDKIIRYISETTNHIYKSSKRSSKKTGGFGMRSGIIEVAQTGILGTLKEVEQTNLYTWIEILEWLREQNEQLNK